MDNNNSDCIRSISDECLNSVFSLAQALTPGTGNHYLYHLISTPFTGFTKTRIHPPLKGQYVKDYGIFLSPGVNAWATKKIHHVYSFSFISSKKRKNAAFTLLEVILALGLSALVIFAIGMAVDVNLRLLDRGRTEVEEAQLARAVLQIMARDIQNAIYSNPSDVNKLYSGTSSTGTTGTSSSQSGQTSSASSGLTSSSQTSSTSSGSSTNSDGTTSTDATTDIAGSAPQLIPGLYGNTNELEIDVSRMPRADQINIAANQSDNSANTGQLSDVKNVVYYLLGNSTSGLSGVAGGSASTGGLVRRELDRATALFSSQQGNLSQTDSNPAPFAPEVEAIQFQYYDGSQWLDEWDSSTEGGLPLAVEITIFIARQKQRITQEALKYRLLVHIPTAQPAQTQTTSTTQTTTTSQTSQ
jgi:hypothetical protein